MILNTKTGIYTEKTGILSLPLKDSIGILLLIHINKEY
jgi:hypothetical protein